MAKKKETAKEEIKIIHKMADGSIRDSIDGYVVPYNEITAGSYHILMHWLERKYQLEG